MKVKMAHIPIAGILTIEYPENMSEREVIEEIAYETEIKIEVKHNNPDVEVYVEEINTYEKIVEGSIVNINLYEAEFESESYERE